MFNQLSRVNSILYVKVYLLKNTNCRNEIIKNLNKDKFARGKNPQLRNREREREKGAWIIKLVENYIDYYNFLTLAVEAL